MVVVFALAALTELKVAAVAVLAVSMATRVVVVVFAVCG